LRSSAARNNLYAIAKNIAAAPMLQRQRLMLQSNSPLRMSATGMPERVLVRKKL
jgi:hypothetical protein